MTKENENVSQPVLPSEDRIHDDNFVLNELKRLEVASTDVFNNKVVNRTNVLDLAAHYPYSPERWRLFRNGNRLFEQYNSLSEYTHVGDAHELAPDAGDTVVLESAERPRYVVAYELGATFSFKLSQSLTDGDALKVGLYDGSDGWYLEQLGSKHSDSQADFVSERDGVEQYREENVNIQLPTTTFSRLKLTTGWYNITRQEYRRSYSKDGIQQNPLIGQFSLDSDRGPKVGNLPVHYSVTASDTTSELTLEAGSAAQVNLGKTTNLTRNKVAVETPSVDTANTWIPLFALRVDPDRAITNVQLIDTAIREFTGNGSIKISAHAFDPSKVLDANGNELTESDYATPEIFTSQNNVLEISTAVDQIPDATGTPTTSTDTPGGWQVGFATLFAAGGNTTTENTAAQISSKRPVYGRDTVVFLANAEDTGDVSIQYRTEQDW